MWALEASIHGFVRDLFKKQRAPVCARLGRRGTDSGANLGLAALKLYDLGAGR